jgi:hypothetical protein
MRLNVALYVRFLSCCSIQPYIYQNAATHIFHILTKTTEGMNCTVKTSVYMSSAKSYAY